MSVSGFFSKNYQTPTWFTEKISRRQVLKSAMGAGMLAATPRWVLAKTDIEQLAKLQQSDPWLTLDAVLEHLLPSSVTGPGAKDINALYYLYQVMTVQPTEQDEKDFIIKGIGWLNDYSNSQLQQPFVQLSTAQKQQVLKAISGSQAGDNWLATLIGYIFEAMLAPPSYGGNPNGIGWQWLEHQAGFPLPEQGGRYWEIPSRYQIKVKNLSPKEFKKA